MESISIIKLINNCIEILEPHFSYNAKQQALFLVSRIANIPYAELLIPDSSLFVDEKIADNIYGAVEMRIRNVPLQYITGKAYFMNEEYSVGEGVLIPRKETEILVEEAFEILKYKSNPNILEFCTGSGCIIISLLKMLDGEQKKYRAVSTDISDVAINYAKKNLSKMNTKIPAEIIKHDILHEDIFQIRKICEKYDMIISNPPYIRTGEIVNLDPQVSSYEPVEALDGGADGLKFYRKISALAAELLSEGGFLLLEIGFDQYDDVADILKKSDIFEEIRYKKDYSDNYRVIIARRSGNEGEV